MYTLKMHCIIHVYLRVLKRQQIKCSNGDRVWQARHLGGELNGHLMDPVPVLPCPMQPPASPMGPSLT